MRELWIRKVTVNTAEVCKRNHGGTLVPITGEIPIPEAQKYILKHQRELTVYKIAYKGTRKNSVRHLQGVHYFSTEEEALAYFNTLSMPGFELQLLSGDWKLLAVKPSDNN